MWQPPPVQSELNSAGAGLALKFSPREVPCGGGGGVSLWAGACAWPDGAQRPSIAAIAAAQTKDRGWARFMSDNITSDPSAAEAIPLFNP